MKRAFSFVSRVAVIVGLLAARAEAQLTVIAAGGDSPPRGTGQFAEGLGVPALSDNGQAAFVSNLREDGFSSGGGIFRTNGTSGNLEVIMLNGDPTPDANGNIGQASGGVININDEAQVAVLVGLTNTLGGGLDDSAIYRGTGGDLTQIARENDQVPGNDGRLATFSPIALNNAGQVAFFSVLRDTAGAASAVYRGNGGPLTQIVRLQQTAPGANLTFTILDVQGQALNESGQVLFSGSGTTVANEPVYSASATRGAAAGFQGLFRGDGSTTVAIAEQGELVPGGNGTYLLLSAGLASLSDTGQAAFFSLLLNTTAGAADNLGIFRGDGDTTVTIARKGEFVPGQNGRYLDFVLGPVINGDGQVLFPASISGASGGSDEGLFVGDGVVAAAVARINDAAPGGGDSPDSAPTRLTTKGRSPSVPPSIFRTAAASTIRSGCSSSTRFAGCSRSFAKASNWLASERSARSTLPVPPAHRPMSGTASTTTRRWRSSVLPETASRSCAGRCRNRRSAASR